MSALVLLRPVFDLGKIFKSKGADKIPSLEWMLELHQTGDFGEAPEWQIALNWESVLRKRGSVRSMYLTNSCEMVWIQTNLETQITLVWMF